MELAKHNYVSYCKIAAGPRVINSVYSKLHKPQKVFMAQSLRQITAHVILFANYVIGVCSPCNRTPARETLVDSGCFPQYHRYHLWQYLSTYPLLIHCSIWQCSRELVLCCRIEVKQPRGRVNLATRVHCCNGRS